MSAGADYLRNQLGTVTTFDGMLDTVADAFDVESGDVTLDESGAIVVDEEEEEAENGNGPPDGPATDFATPQPTTRARRAPARRKRRR